jgi:hypothetical protein
LFAGISGPHKGLTDQEGVDTRAAEAFDVVGRSNPAFAHNLDGFGYPI